MAMELYKFDLEKDIMKCKRFIPMIWKYTLYYSNHEKSAFLKIKITKGML